MKRSLAYITAAWRGDPAVDMEQAAHYCRVVYDAGYSPICPMLYLPLFLNDAVPEEHKNGIDMGRCSSMTRCRRSTRTASTWAAICSGAPVCWWYAAIP